MRLMRSQAFHLKQHESRFIPCRCLSAWLTVVLVGQGYAIAMDHISMQQGELMDGLNHDLPLEVPPRRNPPSPCRVGGLHRTLLGLGRGCL